MEDYLINSVAAETLSKAFPEKNSEDWMLWLQNNRNLKRKVPYRIPFERLGKGVIYSEAELKKFIDWEKGRKLGTIKLSNRALEAIKAFGIGEAGGSSTGRAFKYNLISVQIDAASQKPFIQLILEEPLMVFKLEPEQAIKISEELTKAAKACKRIENAN